LKNYNITIIGGSGALGSWFGKWFVDHGFKVILHGRNKERLLKAGDNSGAMFTQDLVEAVKDADLIMVSVPIIKTPDLLFKVSEHAKKGAILFDVASVKGKITDALEKIRNSKELDL